MKNNDKNIKCVVNGNNNTIKYSKNTILDYINSNNLEFSILSKDKWILSSDENILENDYNFMLDVLKLTRDKKYLNYCSDELKNNPFFIFDIMDILKNDRLYCIELANSFLKENHYLSYEYIKIALKAMEINNEIYNIDKNEIYDLSIYLTASYTIFKNDFEKRMKTDDLGNKMNFELFLINYQEEELFTKFIAKNMIREIFDGLDKPLNLYIKSRFKNPKYIEMIGTKQYILNIIKGHDLELGNYVEFNQDLIEEKIKNLNFYISEWKNEINYDLEEDLFKIIQTYYEYNSEIFIDEYITYIANAINMPSLLEYTYKAANEHLIADGYDPIDYEELQMPLYENTELDEFTRKRLLNKLEKTILLYIKNNKHRYNKVEKVSNICSLKKIRNEKNKLDI